jgi:hypothetical protein
MELLVEREIAGEKAMVEGGKREFEIVGVEAATFLDGAGGGAGAEADIPHGLDDGADGGAGGFFSVVVGECEEDVDVGKGEEVFASVAAEGEHGGFSAGGGWILTEGAAPELDEQAIDDGGAATDGGGAVSGALVGLADKRHFAGVLGAEIVDGEDGRFHERHVGPGVLVMNAGRNCRVTLRISDVAGGG